MAEILAVGSRQPDLLGLKARGGLPIDGALYDLPHLVEPPMRPIDPPLPLHDARTTIGAFDFQFHLFIQHNVTFHFDFRDHANTGGRTTMGVPVMLRIN